MSGNDELAELRELRHTIHKHPEISGEENETGERIVDFLSSGDPDQIKTGIGGTGLAVVYEGQKSGPTLMLRSELDGLPIQEKSDLDYKSEVERKAHMCGHDGHMAMIAGAGRYAERNRPAKGRLVLLYQPAEETGRGAQMILDDPAFNEFRPDFAFALHNLPGFPKGSIILKSGTIASASTGFIARLQGETSHAGHPERGRNPAMAASQLMAALVALPQMETGLHEAALVTPINMRVGREAFGTSAGSADVMVTVRAHDTDLVDTLLNRARELAEDYARTFRLDVTTETTEPFKAVINDEECVETLRQIARGHNYDLVEREDPFSWSEDFGVFTHEFRGAMFGLGSGTDTPGLHNSNYDFPDDILEYGISMFRSLIDHYLSGD